METILVLKVSDIHLYPKIKSTKSDFREMMKDKIINKAKEMFLRLGFKSITMDDIACEMCISKKTIYKYFSNREVYVTSENNTEELTGYSVFSEKGQGGNRGARMGKPKDDRGRLFCKCVFCRASGNGSW